MGASKVTSRTLPAEAPGSHREVASQVLPGRAQLQLHFDREALLAVDEERQRRAFRAAVQAFGGVDALRASLGERETYISKITEALNGQRPIQERWRLPLLRDPQSAVILLHHDSDLAGAEPPVFLREVDQAEIDRAARELLSESGPMRDAYRAQIAKKLGVRPEDVRL